MRQAIREIREENEREGWSNDGALTESGNARIDAVYKRHPAYGREPNSKGRCPYCNKLHPSRPGSETSVDSPTRAQKGDVEIQEGLAADPNEWRPRTDIDLDDTMGMELRILERANLPCVESAANGKQWCIMPVSVSHLQMDVTSQLTNL